MRSQLPTLELDAVFEAKEELALAVKNALASVMSGYGYSIIQVRLLGAPLNVCNNRADPNACFRSHSFFGTC